MANRRGFPANGVGEDGLLASEAGLRRLISCFQQVALTSANPIASSIEPLGTSIADWPEFPFARVSARERNRAGPRTSVRAREREERCEIFRGGVEGIYRVE